MSIENPSFENEPQPEDKPEKSAKDRIKEWKNSLPEMKKEISKREYQKVKEAAEKFRKEHGIAISEEEMEREDQELRKEFGIE